MSTPADLRRTGPAPEAPPPRAGQFGARALLVEDERIVGELLAELLALEGYEVDRAMNGREALELVRRRPYTLIVSDVRMPDADGPAFYYEIRVVRPEVARRMVFVTGDIMGTATPTSSMRPVSATWRSRSRSPSSRRWSRASWRSRRTPGRASPAPPRPEAPRFAAAYLMSRLKRRRWGRSASVPRRFFRSAS